MGIPGAPNRWVFPIPRAQFYREWTLGRATFRPAGDVVAEVDQRRSQVDETKRGHLERWQRARDVVSGFECATVEIRSDTSEEARTSLAETMSIVRFFLRGVIGFNVDVHRIGVPGEVNLAVLDYLLLADSGVTAAGWSLEDAPVNVTFNDGMLSSWDDDPAISWLSMELASVPDQRTVAGRRAITAFTVCDQAFMARDPMTRVLLSALAVETMFATSKKRDRKRSEPLQIARRVAYLTCDCRDGESPLCPYLQGLKRNEDVVQLAEEWSRTVGHWQCSPFLDIATPRYLEPYCSRTSLFSARNEAAHEGRTSADKREVGRLRHLADRSLLAGARWFADHPGHTTDDLDHEIDEAVRRRSVLVPADVRTDP